MINYYVINILEIADNYTSSIICKEESIVVGLGYNIEFDYTIIFCRGYLKKYLSESFIRKVFNRKHAYEFHSINKLTKNQINYYISSLYAYCFAVSSGDLISIIRQVNKLHQEK